MFLRVASVALIGFSFSVSANASWVSDTLALQRQIDLHAPLNQATFIGTHNSENSVAYQIPFVRYIDPNQNISIYDQLEQGVRSIELDVQWTQGARFAKDILLCHGLNNHVGCSVFDKPVSEGFEEVRNWLKSHPNEVVILYFDRALDGHEPRLIHYLLSYLDDYIYRPTALKAKGAPPACFSLPSTVTKADVLKAGKQLLVIAKECDVNAYQEQDKYPVLWNDVVFAGVGTIPAQPYAILDSSFDDDFKAFPQCSKTTTFVNDPLHTSPWRIFEDRTFLSGVVNHPRKITASDVKEFLRCGVNWPTFDMLVKDDERLLAAIWSWAPDYPKTGQGTCALYKNGEGIENANCGQTVSAVACQQENTTVIKPVLAAGTWQDGECYCQAIAGRDWHFATPINGEQMYYFKEAVAGLGVPEVWLNYHEDMNAGWIANE